MPAPGPIQRIASLFSSFHPGERLIDGTALRNLLNLTMGVRSNVVAKAGGVFALTDPTTDGTTTARFVRVSTTATANDSVVLPYPVQGRMVTVWNDGAASLQVFSPSGTTGQSSIVPAGARSTAAVAGNVGIAVAAGAVAQLVCFDTDVWKVLTNG